MMRAQEKATDEHLLAVINLPSVPGTEQQAIEQVAEAVHNLELPPVSLERLKTAVGEATMNAMEHGNHYQADKPVTLQVYASKSHLRVTITDLGGGNKLPESDTPDVEAKLEGLQSARGWGLFLIENMVDEMNITTDEVHHTVELVLNLKGTT